MTSTERPWRTAYCPACQVEVIWLVMRDERLTMDYLTSSRTWADVDGPPAVEDATIRHRQRFGPVDVEEELRDSSGAWVDVNCKCATRAVSLGQVIDVARLAPKTRFPLPV